MKLERLDDGRYRLETMSGQSITCSEHELLQLATLADSHRDQLQQLSSRGGLVTTNISKVVVSIDAHHTEVVLQLFDRDYRQAFLLSRDQAVGTRDGINYQLEEIDRTKNARRTQ